jgi:hypothetical protein
MKFFLVEPCLEERRKTPSLNPRFSLTTSTILLSLSSIKLSNTMPTRLNIHVPHLPGPDAPPPRTLFGLPRLGREPSIAEQNEAHENESLNLEPNNVITNVESLPRIKLSGREFLLESLIHTRRPRTSFVYRKENGLEIEVLNTLNGSKSSISIFSIELLIVILQIYGGRSGRWIEVLNFRCNYPPIPKYLRL